MEAADALARLGDERAVGPLLEALGEPSIDDEESEALMSALEELSPHLTMYKPGSQVVEELIKALNPQMPAAVRIAAAKTLDEGGAGWVAAEGLIKALKDENDDVRTHALWALLHISHGNPPDEKSLQADSLIGAIIEALNDMDEPVRSNHGAVAALLSKALLGVSDARVVEPLIKTLKDEDKVARSNAAEGLGRIKDPRAVKPLIEALKDDYEWVRGSAASALGHIGDIQAIDPITALLDDPKPNVRNEASRALESIRARQQGLPTPDIIGWMVNERYPTPPSPTSETKAALQSRDVEDDTIARFGAFGIGWAVYKHKETALKVKSLLADAGAYDEPITRVRCFPPQDSKDPRINWKKARRELNGWIIETLDETVENT